MQCVRLEIFISSKYHYFFKTLYHYYKCNELISIDKTIENFNIKRNSGKLDGKIFKRSCVQIYIFLLLRISKIFFSFCWVFLLDNLICNDIRCLCIILILRIRAKMCATTVKSVSFCVLPQFNYIHNLIITNTK